MAETLSTQILIERVKDGDRAAREELSNRYLPRVHTAVGAQLGPNLRRKLASWDITQEVMIEALGKIDAFDFRSEGAFLRYVNRIVLNQIRDHADYWEAKRRDPKREISIDGRSQSEEKPLEITGATPTPSQILIQREELSRLWQALDIVAAESPEYRDLIIAAKINGQSYDELAKEGQFGKKPDAIRMKLTRALAKLATACHQLDSNGEER